MKEELLSILRNRTIERTVFRETVQKLSHLLAKDYQTQEKIILVPILRSGLAMLFPFLELLPEVPVGFLGMFRNEKTLKPELYYKNLPKLSQDAKILLLDPMLATGGSIKLAISLLLREGILEKQIEIVSIIGSKMGVQSLKKDYPKVEQQIVAIDEKLDAQGMIVPGIGDFGDRFFGTEKNM